MRAGVYSGRPTTPATPSGDGRLNLLLSYGGWRPDSWVDLAPRLLEPMGIRTVRARSGSEAADLISAMPVHIAVVDLALPLTPREGGGPEGSDGGVPEAGPKILELLARLPEPPPTVVVKRRRTAREDARQLASALHAGAFAVLEPPVELETALEVMRRVLRRHYGDRWPDGGRVPPGGRPGAN